MSPENEAASKEKKADSVESLKLLLFAALGAATLMPWLAGLVTMNAVNGKLTKIGVKVGSEEGESAPGAEGKEKKLGQMVFYDSMEFLVNLSDEEQGHYLKTQISLGTRLDPEEKSAGGGHGGEGKGPQPKLFQRLKTEEPLIRDTIISIISNYTMKALVTSAGKEQLKENLRVRLQQALATDNITVYFTSFTLQ